MKRSFFKKMMKGFTLIEAMVVLALAGGVAATVMYYQGRAANTSTANATVTAVSNMAAKIRSYYSSTGYGNGALTSAAVNGMQLVGQPLKWSGTEILDPWGNTMSVSGATPSFAITIGGATAALDRETCVSIAAALASGADGVRVGGVTNPAVGGVIAGGQEFKSVTAGTTSMANLTSLTGCGAASPVIGLQYH